MSFRVSESLIFTAGLPLTLGSGDAQQIDTATNTPQLLVGYDGTAATPDLTVQPLLKMNRIQSIQGASVSGDGGEQLAAILGITVGDASSQVQSVGVYGGAKNSGTTNTATTSPDACGLYGKGIVLGSGIGVGLGGYIEGARSTATGSANGIEIAVRNSTNTNGSYTPGGFSDTTGIWLVNRVTGGATRNGVGISFGNPSSVKWDVGIGFTSQNGGPIVNSSIRDDSSSVNSIDIRGTHTAAILVAAGSGALLVGRSPAGVNEFSVIQSDDDGHIGLTVYGHSATHSVGIFKVVSSAGANRFLIAAGGDITVADPANLILGTATGTQIGTATNQKLAFYGATPIVRAAAYTPTNVTTDRSYNANSTTIDELADVLGTVIADLQAYGLLG